ncbi:MAG: DoxX family protein [Flavobacteriales bacterium]|nr:DoxX family protein [Flavobacteriales bacterium]|tara:strand:- start:104 stop:535 length:432 start_codon:yes stop_codon:yes gene_type:complete
MNIALSIPNIIYLFICTFFFILFFQSALDKILNKKDNLDWLNSHFKSSILSNSVPLLFFSLTILELISSILFLINIVNIFIEIRFYFLNPILAFCLSMFTFLCLFFGQRIAKDYEGAKTIAIYFTLNILVIIFIFEYMDLKLI